MFFIAIPHRTRESAKANTSSNGGKASNHVINGGIKNTPDTIPETVQVEKSAPKQGTKQRNKHLEKEVNKSITAPSKKAKLTSTEKIAPNSTANITPHPRPRPTGKGEETSKELKKHPILTMTDDDNSDSSTSAPEILNTPAPPQKKAQVDKNNSEPPRSKPQPIRRTGIVSLILKPTVIKNAL